MPSRAPYGIWSNENACFVRLQDIHGGDKIDWRVGQAALCWMELEPAKAAMKQLPEITALKDLCVLPIREEDRPECHKYV